MRRVTRAVVVAAVALLMAGPALADQNRVQRKRGAAPARQLNPRKPRARLQARLKRLDLDGNGSISRQEWKGRPRAFDRLDADHDGQITPAELQRLARTRVRRRVQ